MDTTKLENAIRDPEYRLRLLQEGDEDLKEVIFNALCAVEFVFRAAAAGAGSKLATQEKHSAGDPSSWGLPV